MRFTMEATINYPDDDCDTPQLTNLTRDQLHQVLDKLIDEETDMTSCVLTLVKETK